MFNFNLLNIPESLNMYLCKPNFEIICQLNGIKKETASISLNLNNQCDLSFDYDKYINNEDGEIIESNGYQYLNVGMVILVEKIGFFKMQYPPIKFQTGKEIKTIAASSIECELENKDLVGFKINTGEEDSLEYLVEYEDEETESLINQYTGLPYDYIVFYNTFDEQLQTLLNRGYVNTGYYTDTNIIDEIKKYCDLIPRLRDKVIDDGNGNLSLEEYVKYTYDSSGERIIRVDLYGFNTRISRLITFYQKYKNQLSLLSLAIKKCDCNWSIGKVDESLLNKKFQFDIDGENIYSLLTNTIAQYAYCVFDFDRFRRTINVTLADNIGNDSKVIIDKQNLLNILNISCDDNSICTRYNVSGGNNIGIQYVNFGESRIDNLLYFLNARNENDELIYLSQDLVNKYNQFIADREVARKYYILYTKEYNQHLIDINELKYKVPNDSVQNDWDSFTDAELNNLYNVYNQLLVTLESLYKEDYGTNGCNSDGSINQNYIKNTEYWFDYYAYKQTITQIEEAIHARANNIRYADITDTTILAKINAYKTEWSLYGIVELENKITAYNNSMKVLVDGESIVLNNDGSPKTWSNLTSSQKTEYGNLEVNYHYTEYLDLYNEKISCETYLNVLKSQLVNLESELTLINNNRKTLVKLVHIDGYNRDVLSGLIPLESEKVFNSFSDEEIKIINLLYIDKNYSNENILTTSLDDTVSEIDIQNELLQDAIEQLSIESQPQISFNAEIDNLLCMNEFKDFDFNIGNYVIVEYYDDYYVKLRLSSMSFNPCNPYDSLTVGFTNYIKSKSKRSDITSLLSLVNGNSSNSSSRSSGGGSSGSNGAYGEKDDIDVTISNTMLSKLLNTEMFGTRVSDIILDTIKVNELNAKYAKFEGLANGTTIIDGKCITTGYIIDQFYNGTNGSITNTEGSVLNLETGLFNFGGGNLKWDGNHLSVSGAIIATSLSTGSKTGVNVRADGIYIDSVGNLYAGDNNESILYANGNISFGAGKVTYNPTDGLVIQGKITAAAGSSLGGFTVGNTYITSNTDMTYSSTNQSGVRLSTTGINISSGSASNTFRVYRNGSNLYFNLGDKLVWNGTTFKISSYYSGSYIELSNGAINIKTSSDGSVNGATFNSNGIRINDNSTGNYLSYLSQSGITLYDGTSNNNQVLRLSKYGISMYDSSTNNQTFNLSTSGLYIYDSNSNDLFNLTQTGIHLYKDNIDIGKLGTNSFESNPNYRGLVFDLEHTAQYICWASKRNSSDTSYTTRLIYYNDTDKFDISSPMYFYGNLRINDYLKSVSYTDGGAFESTGGASLKGATYCYMNSSSGNCYIYSENGEAYINGKTKASIYSSNGEVYMHGKINAHMSVDGQQRIAADVSKIYFYGHTTNTVPDGIIDNYNNIDMHNYSILNQSDARLKKNIEDTNVNALSILSQLKLKQFDWIETNEHEDIGFIAQQVQSVISNLVFIDSKSDKYSIKSDKFIPYLVKAIQELYQIINELLSTNNDETIDESEIIESTNSNSITTKKSMSIKKKSISWEDYSLDDKIDFIDSLDNNTQQLEIHDEDKKDDVIEHELYQPEPMIIQ